MSKEIHDSHCLLCNTVKSGSINTFVASGNPTTAPSAIVKQLRVIFILRKVLRVPSDYLIDYLRTYGNPENWIWLCTPCSLLVDQSKALYDLQQEVTRKFTGAARSIVKLVTQTYSPYSSQAQGSHGANSSIRDFVSRNGFLLSAPHESPAGASDLSLTRDMTFSERKCKKLKENTRKKNTKQKKGKLKPKILFSPPPQPEQDEEMIELPETSENFIWLGNGDNEVSVKTEPTDTEGFWSEDDEAAEETHDAEMTTDAINNVEDEIGDPEPATASSSSNASERGETTEFYNGFQIKSFTHQQKIRFRCPSCPMSYTLKWYLLQHIKNVHQSRLKCKFCERCFMAKDSLRSHMIKEHQSQDYGNRVELVSQLVASAELKANKGKKNEKPPKELPRFLCTTCGSEFCSNNNLKRHIFAVHEKKCYKCDLCGQTYTQKYHFKKHLLTSHIDSDAFKEGETHS